MKRSKPTHGGRVRNATWLDHVARALAALESAPELETVTGAELGHAEPAPVALQLRPARTPEQLAILFPELLPVRRR